MPPAPPASPPLKDGRSVRVLAAQFNSDDGPVPAISPSSPFRATPTAPDGRPQSGNRPQSANRRRSSHRTSLYGSLPVTEVIGQSADADGSDGPASAASDTRHQRSYGSHNDLTTVSPSVSTGAPGLRPRVLASQGSVSRLSSIFDAMAQHDAAGGVGGGSSSGSVGGSVGSLGHNQSHGRGAEASSGLPARPPLLGTGVGSTRLPSSASNLARFPSMRSVSNGSIASSTSSLGRPKPPVPKKPAGLQQRRTSLHMSTPSLAAKAPSVPSFRTPQVPFSRIAVVHDDATSASTSTSTAALPRPSPAVHAVSTPAWMASASGTLPVEPEADPFSDDFETASPTGARRELAAPSTPTAPPGAPRPPTSRFVTAQLPHVLLGRSEPLVTRSVSATPSGGQTASAHAHDRGHGPASVGHSPAMTAAPAPVMAAPSAAAGLYGGRLPAPAPPPPLGSSPSSAFAQRLGVSSDFATPQPLTPRAELRLPPKPAPRDSHAGSPVLGSASSATTLSVSTSASASASAAAAAAMTITVAPRSGSRLTAVPSIPFSASAGGWFQNSKIGHVVQELVSTEQAYHNDLELLTEVYARPSAAYEIFPKNTHRQLFGGVEDLVHVSGAFAHALSHFVSVNGDEVHLWHPKHPSDLWIGTVFLQFQDIITSTYIAFCKQHEAVQVILQQLVAVQSGGPPVDDKKLPSGVVPLTDSDGRIRQFLETASAQIHGKTAAWDLASLVIKPVQRVLKYPLLFGSLHKMLTTELADRSSGVPAELQRAVAPLAEAMASAVAIAEKINRVKECKDLVDLIVEGKGPSNVIHGVAKKWTRGTMQLKQKTGLAGITRQESDQQYDLLEQRFRAQLAGAQSLRGTIQEYLASVGDYYVMLQHQADAFEMLTLFPDETEVSDAGGPGATGGNSHSDSDGAGSAAAQARAHAHIGARALSPTSSKALEQEAQRLIDHVGNYRAHAFRSTPLRTLEDAVVSTLFPMIKDMLFRYEAPMRIMRKRDNKRLDYDRRANVEASGGQADAKLVQSATAFLRIDEQLREELPKFLNLIEAYFGHIMATFLALVKTMHEEMLQESRQTMETLRQTRIALQSASGSAPPSPTSPCAINDFNRRASVQQAKLEEAQQQFVKNFKRVSQIPRMPASGAPPLDPARHAALLREQTTGTSTSTVNGSSGGGGGFLETYEQQERDHFKALQLQREFNQPSPSAAPAEPVDLMAFSPTTPLPKGTRVEGAITIFACGKPVDWVATALYQFDAEYADEVSFAEGEVLQVVMLGGRDQDYDDAWLLGFNSQGQKGWFPHNFVNVISQD